MAVRFDPILNKLLTKYVKTTGDFMTGSLNIIFDNNKFDSLYISNDNEDIISVSTGADTDSSIFDTEVVSNDATHILENRESQVATTKFYNIELKPRTDLQGFNAAAFRVKGTGVGGSGDIFKILDGGGIVGVFSRTWLPFADNIYDLGASDARWRNLYLKGTIKGQGSPDTFAFDASIGNVLVTPNTDNANLTLRQTSASSPTANIMEITDSGDTDTFLAVDKDGILQMGANIQPDTDSAFDLGTSSIFWAEAYIDKLFLNSTATLDGSTAGEIHVTGVIEDTTGTLTLRNANSDGITLGTQGSDPAMAPTGGTSLIIGSSGNQVLIGASVGLNPQTDSLIDLGTSSLFWANAYIDKIFLNSTATLDGASAGVITSVGDIVPSSDGTDSIGSTGNRFLKGWFDDVESTNMPTVGGTSIEDNMVANSIKWSALL